MSVAIGVQWPPTTSDHKLVPQQQKLQTLQLATLSATYNIILQISLIVGTFVANAVILRSVSEDVFAVINVRLLLLYTTIQFLSREPLRRVSISATKSHDWQLLVNLISLSIPLSLVFGTILCLIWYYIVEQPDPQLVADYGVGLVAVLVSVVIELLAEPLYVFGQTLWFIKLKVAADGLFLMTRTLIMVALISHWPHRAVLVFSGAQICGSLLYVCLYYLYFICVDKQQFGHFMPDWMDSNMPHIDRSLIRITMSFIKNTTLKQLLTEGERLVMIFFRVLTSAEKGVYDVVNNVGSIPGRLVFAQIEDSGFVLFTQKIDRQMSATDQSFIEMTESATIVRNFIKLMTLFGLIVLTFGFNYSELALLLYGGHQLVTADNGLATQLLQWHCLYILFLAVNCMTECFTFAATNSRQLDSFNKYMCSISIAFLFSLYLLPNWFGCQGFIMANCFSMGARIVISVRFIKTYYRTTEIDEPFNGSIPHLWTNVSFLATFVLLFMIKPYLCCTGDSTIPTIVYVMLGLISLTINLIVIYVKERDLVIFVNNLYKF